MGTTAWDGRVRVDHLADAVAVTLDTVEATREAELRAGLVAAFVSDDPHGPPTWVAVTLRDGRVPADVGELLGDRLAAAVDDLLDSGRDGDWLQLDLREVHDLSTAWAPYRARVALAAGEPQPEPAGTWPGGLWSWAGLGGVLGAGTAPALRGDRPEPVDDGDASGVLRLPDAVAAAAAVDPVVAWSSAGPDARGTVRVVLRAAADPGTARRPDALEVCVDDGEQAWTELTGTGGELRATIEVRSRAAGLRFRTRDGQR